MPPHIMNLPPNTLIEASRSVRLGYDHKRTTVWFELTNSPNVFNAVAPEGQRFVRVFIGAVQQLDRWVPITPQHIGRLVNVTYREITGDPGPLGDEFAASLYKSWQTFNPSSPGKWADRDSPDHNASFVIKALRDASREPVILPFGPRKSRVDEAVELWNRITKTAGVSGARASEFVEVIPAGGCLDEQLPDGEVDDYRDIGLIVTKRCGGDNRTFAYAGDTVQSPFQRVVSYGFRGDDRAPDQIREQGGFLANYTRADPKYQLDIMFRELASAIDYNNGRGAARLSEADFLTRRNVTKVDINDKGERVEKIEEIVEIRDRHRLYALINDAQKAGAISFKALDLKAFLQLQKWRGYISLTKSVAIAKFFACGGGGTTEARRKFGYVYACYAEGAFHIPPSSMDQSLVHDEQELSVPGLVEWTDVVGYRKVVDDKFVDKVFLRRGLESIDPEAVITIWKLLSGESQGEFVPRPAAPTPPLGAKPAQAVAFKPASGVALKPLTAPSNKPMPLATGPAAPLKPIAKAGT